MKSTVSGEAEQKLLLAEVHYRRDEFENAAALVGATGKEAKAKKLVSFKGQTPYLLRGRRGRAPTNILRAAWNEGFAYWRAVTARERLACPAPLRSRSPDTSFWPA